jgi:nicotinamidase/pyrazinamidase
MMSRVTIRANDILIIIDVQNDFCPGGALPVPQGDEVVSPINRLGQLFEHVALTQDWHPRGHSSFASSHNGCKPFEIIEASYGPQTLWPDHCVQGTPGAQLHASLSVSHAELILRKGFRRDIDSYSAFFENDRKTPTGLGGYLRERGFTRVFLAGLALDYCVRYSAEDAQALGFVAVIIEDACRAINAAGSLEDARRSFWRHNISIAATWDVA